MTAVADVACETWEFIDPDSVVTTLNKASGLIVGRVQGAHMPPAQRFDIRLPGRPGAFNLARSYRERTVSMEAMFYATTTAALETLFATWATRMNVLRGGGQLRHTRTDGSIRRVLNCDYADGLGLDQARGIWRQGAQQLVFQFFAADPFWYDDADTTASFTTASGGGFFPIPNVTTGSFITLVSSTVFGTVTVNNTGDIDIYPVWTITGPGSGIVLRNVTTGKIASFDNNGGLVLTAGQVLTVDTRPGFTRIELADGTNKASYLTDASELWPIVRGSNALRVEMSGSSGASAVALAYKKGFLTP